MSQITEPRDTGGPAMSAAFTMHAPSGPTNACVKHARQIEGLFRFLGVRVAATKAPEGTQCDNCVNETKATGSAS